MPRRGTKAINRTKTTRQGKHRRTAARRAGAAKSRVRIQVRHRGPRISRGRLRTMREDLVSTQNAVSDTIEKFWIIPEQDIRQTLAKTQQKIGRAVQMLEKAA
jgi:hypothetical protein